MREILFRGRRISDGSWVEGGIIKTFHPNFDHESPETFKFLNANCYCICANNRDIFVEQESISQFTGLTDKNGKKIFEGDIVKHYCSSEDKTIFDVGQFYWCENICQFRRTSRTEGQFYDVNNSCEYEVIGNIYDNPELLKVGEG